MIRQAKPEDFDDITYIRKNSALDLLKLTNTEYRISIQQNGFILPKKITKEEFEQDLQKIYLVYEKNNGIEGFIRIDQEQELKNPAVVSWLKPEIKNIYFSLPHADLGVIVTSPNAKGKGVATALVKEACKKIKQKGIPYLFSFVVLSPITNFPSMMFHEKNGFERIAVSTPHPLFGMNNFQSFLYGKKL